MPIHTWYTCMFLMTSTPKAVSAKDMEQRLGMKRYEPEWYMMQKIRRAMCRANESVQLTGTVELDDGYFTAHRTPEPGDELFNRGRGSVRKQPVLATVEYREGAKRKSATDTGIFALFFHVLNTSVFIRESFEKLVGGHGFRFETNTQPPLLNLLEDYTETDHHIST